jgi:hypothetical protein
MYAQLKAVSLRLQRKPKVLRLLWSVIFPLAVGSCYFGAVISTMAVETFPLQFVARFRGAPKPIVYWVVTLTDIAVIAALCAILATGIVRLIRKQRVEIDLMAMFFGSVLALCLALMILAVGGWPMPVHR